MAANSGEKAVPPKAVERIVAKVLRAGVIASSSIILLGLALLVAGGAQADSSLIDRATPMRRSLGSIASGLLRLDPASVISFGLLALIATPICRVLVSIVAFAIEGDRRYVIITALVLAILAVSVLMGNAAG
jgi:uncharacterized membrane protein